MFRAIALLVLLTCLAGCGQFGLLDGIKYVHAVEDELEHMTGVKPQVGFSWNNGRVRSVTLTLPRIFNVNPVIELADKVRAVVEKECKQTPDAIVLAFVLAR